MNKMVLESTLTPFSPSETTKARILDEVEQRMRQDLTERAKRFIADADNETRMDPPLPTAFR